MKMHLEAIYVMKKLLIKIKWKFYCSVKDGYKTKASRQTQMQLILLSKR